MPRIRIDWDDNAVLTGLYARLVKVNWSIRLSDSERRVLEKILKRYVDADVQRKKTAEQQAEKASKELPYRGGWPPGTGAF